MNRPLEVFLASALVALPTACGGPQEVGDAPTEAELPLGARQAPEDAPVAAEVQPSLIDVLRRDGRFDTFVSAAEAAGLDRELERGRYTVFAPTDAAFEERFPDGTLDELLSAENRTQLDTILRYHVVEDALPSAEIAGRIEGQTLAGDALTVEESEGRLLVGGQGGAVVTDADIRTPSGVVHVIDRVLLPPAG